MDVIQRVTAVYRDADHEYICFLELNLAIRAQVVISARIVDLELNLLLLDVLGASEDIEHGRLVIVCENVLEVVFNEAGLADGGVADEHNFDHLWSFVINHFACFRWIIIDQLRL